jgi:glycine/D-amino acid oxidase-like deaminating enzyme
LKLTTLAIIGGGIAGRSVLYTLAKGKRNFSKVLLFDSSIFLTSCSLHSTAIVAPRGVSRGHSALGDKLVAGFACFSEHVKKENPVGVFPISQYTGALTKIEAFKERYPHTQLLRTTPFFSMEDEIWIAEEEAYLIDPRLYLEWLLEESLKHRQIELHSSFVTQVEDQGNKFLLSSQEGMSYQVDQLIICGGYANRFWRKDLGRPVQGSYLEFHHQNLGEKSFSLTLEGDNLIYQGHAKRLLVGSTTHQVEHALAPATELKEIYHNLQSRLTFKLPEFSQGQIKVGMREKAAKREPYLKEERGIFYLGGMYKNGYSLSLLMAQELVSKL